MEWADLVYVAPMVLTGLAILLARDASERMQASRDLFEASYELAQAQARNDKPVAHAALERVDRIIRMEATRPALATRAQWERRVAKNKRRAPEYDKWKRGEQ